MNSNPQLFRQLSSRRPEARKLYSIPFKFGVQDSEHQLQEKNSCSLKGTIVFLPDIFVAQYYEKDSAETAQLKFLEVREAKCFKMSVYMLPCKHGTNV